MDMKIFYLLLLLWSGGGLGLVTPPVVQQSPSVYDKLIEGIIKKYSAHPDELTLVELNNLWTHLVQHNGSASIPSSSQNAEDPTQAVT